MSSHRFGCALAIAAAGALLRATGCDDSSSGAAGPIGIGGLDGSVIAPTDGVDAAPDDSGAVPSDAGGSACTYVLSGAASYSGSCNAYARYFSNGVGTQLEFYLVDDPQPAGHRFQFLTVFAIDSAAPLTAGTYTTANTVSSNGEWLSASMSWVERDTKLQSTPVGAFTLTITDVSAQGPDAGVVDYALHGTLSATLPETSAGATGTVTAEASF